LPKIKDIKIKLHRELAQNFKTVTISKTPTGKYFASFVIQETIINHVKAKQILVNINDILGIDLGISDFAITSTNQKIANLRLLDKSLPKLAKWQKINARKKYTIEQITTAQGKSKNIKIYSKNKEKSKLNIARMHEKIANQRNDYLHKVSHSIVSKSQATYIAIEDLNVRGMIKNKKLARHISNALWYKFTTMLSYKAKWNNKKVISIDRFAPSSKTCSCCGHKLDKLPLSIREWAYPNCRTKHDRDINASRNIAKFAQIKLADGLGRSLAVKSSSTSKLISISEVAKGTYTKYSTYGSQETPPIV
jgi:putative transposase